MSLQGNLRDFAATEILQLLGMQRKTGCLTLQQDEHHAMIFVHDGRIVSTRPPGMTREDPLLRFLLRAHRLSEEQHRGIATIQRESGRDLEDLLLNGRYLESDELISFIERQILDDLTRVMQWDHGNYYFDPRERWPHPLLARLSVEAALIEVARRSDERKRFATVFADPHQVLRLHDVPDPDVDLADDESDLFGIIDGRRTVAEIVRDAPLADYEAYEALHRMMEANWIEFAGRRDPDVRVEPVPLVPSARPVRHSLVHELALLVLIASCCFGVYRGIRYVRPVEQISSEDVFVTSQVRDLRHALELFRRERGRYPRRLDELITDRWITASQARVPDHTLVYHLDRSEQDYRLLIEPNEPFASDGTRPASVSGARIPRN